MEDDKIVELYWARSEDALACFICVPPLAFAPYLCYNRSTGLFRVGFSSPRSVAAGRGVSLKNSKE